MKPILTALFLLSPAIAIAQDAPAQPYVPITLTEADAKKLQEYLDQQPYKMAAPVIQFLAELQQRAQAKAKGEAKLEK